jgi:predicted flap endonuclease-1-like 5' DNA nuclease
MAWRYNRTRIARLRASVFAILAAAAVLAALAIGYLIGRAQRPRVEPPAAASEPASAPPPAIAAPVTAPVPQPAAVPPDSLTPERARLVRGYEAEAAAARRVLGERDAALVRFGELAADRRRLFGELAQARGETARYRQLVVSLEDDAPPPLLGGPGTPDDLKLIVGVGPVLERMLYQLGITTYRQIARWTERDIDDFDARLPEFPGRIRRDAWVTQAKALHQSKYGASASPRDRG